MTTGAPPRTDTQPEDIHPRRRRLALTGIPLLGTAFGFVGGFAIGQHLALAGFGFVWGVVAMLVAPRLARRGRQSAAWADTPVLVMLPLAFIVLGGALLGHLAGPTPATFLRLLEQPGYGTFFYALHGPFEWLLMPWALIANWHHRARRRLLVITAVVFYLGRAASAVYFAPNATHWGQHPADAQLDEVSLWIGLDLIRLVLQDALTAALLFAAALHPRLRPHPLRGKPLGQPTPA